MNPGDEAGTLAEAIDVRADADEAPGAAPASDAGADQDGADQPDAGQADAGQADAGQAGAVRDASRHGAPVWLATMAVLLILLIAGAATVAVYLNRVNGIDARDGSRQAAISAARTAITDLTTADYRNPQQYMDRLKPLAAGQFLNMFTNSAAGFKDILAQGKVQTTGRVVAVGVQHFHGDTAQLSVLAYETVSNSQTPKGSERAYRMSVSMILSGSRWLVSNVEFVQ